MIPARARTLVATALLAVLSLSIADPSPAIDGVWLSGDGDGWIEITATTTSISGVKD